MDTVSNYTETLEKTVRDLLKRQEDLIRTAFTDQLTGLGNRGGFARSLEELWEQDTPVTMAYVDIDNLKHCNDVFGHDEGNRYILQVSLYLKLYMKVGEAAFRWEATSLPSYLRLQPRTTSPNVWNTAERSCSKTTIPRCPTRLATECHMPTPPWAKPAIA